MSKCSMKTLLSSALVVALFGCGGGTSTVKGRVTDSSGSQSQEMRARGDSYGGSGTVSEASTVKLSAIGSGGSLEAIATANVSADGSYQLQAPAGEQKMIIQAFSASGELVASAIVESTGSAGDEVTVTPMDTESSVEAEVLVEMVAQGTAVAEANAIDLRARLNASVAASVRGVATAGGDARAKIRALAESVIAAQRTELRAYARAGVTVTQEALFNAELQAAQKLNASLHGSAQSAEQAYADFLTAVDMAAESKGADASERAQAESSASASFRATLKVRSGSTDPVTDAALRAAASLEARSSAVAIDAILRAGSASQTVVNTGVSAGTTLRQQVSASTTATTAAQAFASFRGSVTGSGNVSSSLLGAYLGVDTTSQVTAQLAVNASATAAATLDATLNTTIEAAVRASGAIDFNAVANSVVDAYATFQASVRAQAAALATFGSKAQPSTELMIVAQGSMRISG